MFVFSAAFFVVWPGKIDSAVGKLSFHNIFFDFLLLFAFYSIVLFKKRETSAIAPYKLFSSLKVIENNYNRC